MTSVIYNSSETTSFSYPTDYYNIVKTQDIENLKEYNINFTEYEPNFLSELKEYLLDNWAEEFHSDLENMEQYTFNDFCKKIGYPYSGCQTIIENSFDENLNDCKGLYKLSTKFKIIMGYFFDILLYPIYKEEEDNDSIPELVDIEYQEEPIPTIILYNSDEEDNEKLVNEEEKNVVKEETDSLDRYRVN